MAQPRNLPDYYPEEITSLPMFHPDISKRQQAEDYVHQHDQGEGSFLVRPNTESDPSYVSITVSILGNRTCNAKVFIERTTTGISYYISDKNKFPTFLDLLSYYREHRIHCQQGINVRLLLPLRKINQHVPRKISPNGVAGAHRSPSSSSNSDETAVKVIGSKQASASKEDLTKKREIYKHRAYSDSNMQVGKSGPGTMKTHGRLLNSQSTGNGNVNNTASQSSSLSQINDLSSPIRSKLVLKYSNPSAKQDPKYFMRCRPPAPLPRPESQSSDDNFYYTSIDANKDFFHETYQLLKVNELCECGLRICDSELALGWTIHRSQDPATLNHIFFQHGENTTWDMPIELADKLTDEQIMFIIYVCREGMQRVPVCLRKILDRKLRRPSNDRRQ